MKVRRQALHTSGSEWTLPSAVTMQPYNVPGWQVVRITLVAKGTPSEYQLYNFYIDPYVRR